MKVIINHTIKYAPEDQYKTQLTNIHEF